MCLNVRGKGLHKPLFHRKNYYFTGNALGVRLCNQRKSAFMGPKESLYIQCAISPKLKYSILFTISV